MAYQKRENPLFIEPNEFESIASAIGKMIAEFHRDLSNYPVSLDTTPEKIKAKLVQGSLPEKGDDAKILVERAFKLIKENSTFNSHPRFMGYITSSPSLIGILGDFIASAMNPNIGLFGLAPMGTEIESQTISWISEMVGYHSDAAGVLVSGGNTANFLGFLAARKAHAAYDIRKQGVDPTKGKMRVYVSDATHTWIQKAVDLFGLGTDSIRWIPTDSDQKINTSLLEKQILEDKSQGDNPFMVVGTAGTVATGAVDSLDEISSICKANGLWFHVDGAYGAFAAVCPNFKYLFKGIENADSIAVDPHKWLYSPLEAGCTLVKDKRFLIDAFGYYPEYYNLGDKVEAPTNYFEYGFQNSRGFRALKIWLSLLHAGKQGYQQLIADDIQLAGLLWSELKKRDDFELFTKNLSIVTFGYVPSEMGLEPNLENLNRLNELLMDKLQKGGDLFLSNAVLGENYLLRICIVNFRTEENDIMELPEIISRYGKEIAKEDRYN